jgi:hypothetical protein
MTGRPPGGAGHRPRTHLLAAVLWTSLAAAGVAAGTLAAAHHIPLLNEAAVAVFFIGVVAAARSAIAFRRSVRSGGRTGNRPGSSG